MFQLRATFSSPRASASVRERTDNSPSASLLRPQQLVDSPPPQLPPGWASATDPSSKRRYYYHAARKTVQWSPPNAAATPTDAPPGPPTTARPPTVTNTNTNTNMPAAIDVAPPRSPVTPTDFVQKLPGYPHSQLSNLLPYPSPCSRVSRGSPDLASVGHTSRRFLSTSCHGHTWWSRFPHRLILVDVRLSSRPKSSDSPRIESQSSMTIALRTSQRGRQCRLRRRVLCHLHLGRYRE